MEVFTKEDGAKAHSVLRDLFSTLSDKAQAENVEKFNHISLFIAKAIREADAEIEEKQ